MNDPVVRRWALTTTPIGTQPLILATYWTHAAAHRARNHLTARATTQAYRTPNYTVTPMDHARYRDRANAIATALHRGPRSTAGIAHRTTMTDHTIGRTLLRMAREHRVVHVIPGDPDTDEPALGVWRLLSYQERIART